MGYTHYWKATARPNDAEWEKFTGCVAQMLDAEIARGVPLAYEYDQPNRSPLIDNRIVRFNGVGEAGYETFNLDRAMTPFGFCKTGPAAYDTAVVATLCLAQRFLPGFSWSSDGDQAELQAGYMLAEEHAQATVV